MNHGSPSVRYLLNNLIESCEDGQESFRAAVEDLEDPSLQSVLTEFAQQHAAFSRELRSCVALEDRTPSHGLDALATLHRSWIQFNIARSHGDEHAILVECERAEDGALEEYRRALAVELPPALATVVRRQYTELQNACERVHELCDSTEPAG